MAVSVVVCCPIAMACVVLSLGGWALSDPRPGLGVGAPVSRWYLGHVWVVPW